MNNPGMTKLPDMLDLAFDVSGATPPANYPFALWAALLDLAAEGPDGIQILPALPVLAICAATPTLEVVLRATFT